MTRNIDLYTLNNIYGSIISSEARVGDAVRLEQDAIIKSAALIRRSHLEIKMDILRAVMEGAEKPTQIMYKANISWAILKTHLKNLVDKDFVQEAEYGNRRRYELTSKGINILRAYTSILEQINSANRV